MPTFDGSPVTTNSYSSIGDVLAYTRHYLDGQTTFNSTTRPRLSEVTRFLNRASGYMNMALKNVGLAIPITQADAKAAIDDWVALRAAEYVEMTQRGTGYSDGEGSRLAAFRGIAQDANEFAKTNRQAFIDLGVTVTRSAASGISFTALEAVDQRNDPTDTSLVQPIFRRGLFAPGTSMTTGGAPGDTEE